MAGINKVIIVGNLGNDPEVAYLPNGGAVTKISVATSKKWKDKNTGQDQEQTEWHRIVFFNRLGEIAGEYLKKGSKVYVEGALKTNKWKDKDGNDRYTTEIIGNEMQMLDGKGGNNDPEQHASGNRNQPNPTYEPSVTNVENDPENFDDDIPF
jgi:single-strand DNA-binding protein